MVIFILRANPFEKVGGKAFLEMLQGGLRIVPISLWVALTGHFLQCVSRKNSLWGSLEKKLQIVAGCSEKPMSDTPLLPF